MGVMMDGGGGENQGGICSEKIRAGFTHVVGVPAGLQCAPQPAQTHDEEFVSSASNEDRPIHERE
jgi:hypothetical protein